ncbi:nucleolus protein [Dichomitus squalens]|uniref:25S rRNA adenine-N(1) methyltransferase n=1 Tax=Dichomitus squalens TaxID=114155 RepID=A0A4Q9P6J2_9APHY|nr:nucleolus protein [Dichomitus squalens LYAD-421 SS1]EJF62440.1 nucleolus protein [Dichomitus squalens LYAD-421 SS1]TBU50110.1 nucleolus protein [Dichomitus squalens]TBU66132.1 nucleolus protein [Dichomitus squalens]
MPKSRKNKRKAPVTSAGPFDRSSLPSGSASHRPGATRTIIRRFHVLIKRQTQLQHLLRDGDTKKGKGPMTAARAELAEVERGIEELGGLAAYQRMSTIGQSKDRGGGSEKIFIGWLRELETPEEVKRKGVKLRLLEVGALKPDNYSSCQTWIEVTPIDLHSQHPNIQEQDFLLMDSEEHREKWDAISMSLVLNFVPDAKNRGRMLKLAHNMLRPSGLLFVALPLPCIMNSRYTTAEHYEGLMYAIGFEKLLSRWKDGGKMAYWLFRRSRLSTSATYQKHALYEKKTVFRTGDRNNFVILL